jgi:MFS family permease
MPNTQTNIVKLYAFSFLQMTLFPMAIITLFWKDQIGLTLTQILLLQSILSLVMVVMEYPSGYISDRVGYRAALTVASFLGMAGWGLYVFASSFSQVLVAEILLGISLAFISGSDSALLYETLKSEGSEHLYARHQGRMSAFAQAGESFGALFAGLLYATAPVLPFLLQGGVWFLALLLTRSMVEPHREFTSRPATWPRPSARPVTLLSRTSDLLPPFCSIPPWVWPLSILSG